MTRKVCPLLLMVKEAITHFGYPLSEECLEEGCAWWDEDSRACCFLLLARFLREFVSFYTTER